MKNPVSFLTFSSITLSVCLLAQYLTDSKAEALFSALFLQSGSLVKTVFFGASRLAQLFFGIYCALASTKNRFVNLYFFGFSGAVYIIAHVLLFENKAYFFAAAFSAVMIFVSAVLFSASAENKRRTLLLFPQSAVGIFLFIISILAMIK